MTSMINSTTLWAKVFDRINRSTVLISMQHVTHIASVMHQYKTSEGKPKHIRVWNVFIVGEEEPVFLTDDQMKNIFGPEAIEDISVPPIGYAPSDQQE